MKKIISIFLVGVMIMLAGCTKTPNSAISADININQLGYLPTDTKIAVLRGENISGDFSVVDAKTGKSVYTGTLSEPTENPTAGECDRYADFSSVTAEGTYYIVNPTLGKSYKFKISSEVYSEAFLKTIKMFYLQRCGESLTGKYAGKWKHKACHTSPATVWETGEKIDVSGGWHDAGDYGKYTVAGAKAVVDLMLAYTRNPEKFTDCATTPESGNSVPDVLNEVRYELLWMLKMQRPDGGVYHKVTTQNFPGVIMPQEDAEELYVTPVSTTATADFAGAMALAYTVYKSVDDDFAGKCLNAAELAWSFLEANPQFVYNNISEITTGDYDDTEDADERYFAACSLLAATGDIKYAEALKDFSDTHFYLGLGWQSVAAYGSYLVLSSENGKKIDSALYKQIYDEFLNTAEWLLSVCQKDGYGISLDENGYCWGSNMGVANNAMHLLMANDIAPNAEYVKAAKAHLDYLFGKNPLGMSFVTGTGSVSPQNPHHRPSQYTKKAAEGMLVGGPDSNLDDDYVKATLQNTPPAKCYADIADSYSTNEITIYWNSPLVFILSEFV